MKKLMYGIAVLALAATVLPAQAKPPKFKATCPTEIEVRANKEGRVRINDKDATVKEFSATAWDAKQGDVTVSIGVIDDKLQVMYTGKGGVNGVCEVTGYEAGAGDAAKVAIPAADEQACLQAVKKETNNPTVATLRTNSSEANNTVIVGVGADKAKWKCLVKDGKVAGVMSMTNEGAN